MSQPPRGLGKGLSAILGNVPGAEELQGKPEVAVKASGAARSAADVLMIPLGDIEPAVAIGGRNVCFMLNPVMGMIELVEDGAR